MCPTPRGSPGEASRPARLQGVKVPGRRRCRSRQCLRTPHAQVLRGEATRVHSSVHTYVCTLILLHVPVGCLTRTRAAGWTGPKWWLGVARGGWNPAFRGMDVVVGYRPRDKIVEVPRGTVHEACFWKGIIARNNKKLIGPCVVLSIRFKSSFLRWIPTSGGSELWVRPLFKRRLGAPGWLNRHSLPPWHACWVASRSGSCRTPLLLRFGVVGGLFRAAILVRLDGLCRPLPCMSCVPLNKGAIRRTVVSRVRRRASGYPGRSLMSPGLEGPW